VDGDVISGEDECLTAVDGNRVLRFYGERAITQTGN